MTGFNSIGNGALSLRFHRWFLAVVVVLGLVTCFLGIMPASYFLWCVGIAVVGFTVFALAVRLRSSFLGFFGQMFVMFSQIILYDHCGTNQVFEILQGGAVTCAVVYVFALFFASWSASFRKDLR